MVLDYRHDGHTVSRLSTHIVLVTKYRKRVLSGDIQLRCRDLIKQVCDSEDVIIIIRAVIKNRKTVVILTSGYFDEASTMKSFAHRNYRFIAKPYVLETLLKCIKDVLGARK